MGAFAAVPDRRRHRHGLDADLPARPSSRSGAAWPSACRTRASPTPPTTPRSPRCRCPWTAPRSSRSRGTASPATRRRSTRPTQPRPRRSSPATRRRSTRTSTRVRSMFPAATMTPATTASTLTNSAVLVHTLMFAVDSDGGRRGHSTTSACPESCGRHQRRHAGSQDRGRLPRQAAKDADGGFYHRVGEREYESNVLPGSVATNKSSGRRTPPPLGGRRRRARGDRLLAAPTSRGTAGRRRLPGLKAKAGWTFLTNAIAKYGKAGAYQKITHYGDDFTHDDELAWAATAMFVATGDASNRPRTMKSCCEPRRPRHRALGAGEHCSISPTVTSLRLLRLRGPQRPPAAKRQLDATFLAKCEAEVRRSPATTRSSGRSRAPTARVSRRPPSTCRARAGSSPRPCVRYRCRPPARQPRARHTSIAIVRNDELRGRQQRAQPLSTSTGLGWKRQKEIVHQYAQNDDRVFRRRTAIAARQASRRAWSITSDVYGTEGRGAHVPARDNGRDRPARFL